MILIKAISFLGQLKGCLASLVHFFEAVNTTIQVSMSTTMNSFIGLVEDTTKDVSLGGLTLSSFAKQVRGFEITFSLCLLYSSILQGHLLPGVRSGESWTLGSKHLGGSPISSPIAGCGLHLTPCVSSTGVPRHLRSLCPGRCHTAPQHV